ncbi:CapA family protein [Chryseotalea sanaruensis]|uniref:CapA family protein n=1 Tax=Chryseotalea sanaruensis TaxID=2482724 RepID=A0A401UAD9_9BACT|nr:CapA family protein [Chryseotalea sanaruensis]
MVKIVNNKHCKILKLVFVLLIIGLNAAAQDTTRLSLLFTGDVMGHDSQIAAAYNASTGSYDYTSCFQFVKPYIAAADLAIGNLEVTLAGAPYKGYPAFSSPDALAVDLQDVGFDVLVTANNHSCDKGKRGIERTIEMLDSFKIVHTGTFTDEASRLNDYPLILEKNGFKLALLNYTYGTNGIPVPKPTIVNAIDTAQIRKDITQAKLPNPDYIIAFMHWGSEYQSQPNAYQKVLTKYLFDSGVQLVIGAHPHVLQPMQFNKENQQLVVYSLGNFVSGQRDRYKNGGAMVRIDLSKIRNDSVITKHIDSVNYILQYVHRDAQKKYVVLPVPTFENDTTGFIKDELSKQNFKTFITDSRLLFSKYNANVNESRLLHFDSTSYSIKLFTVEKTNSRVPVPPLDTFYGLHTNETKDGKVDYYLGFFKSREEAERILENVKKSMPYHDSSIAIFYNSKPAE